MAKKNILIFMVMLLIVAQTTLATLPDTINLQGRLLDDEGAVVSGTHQFVFKIYDVPTGGSAVWSETHSDVDVSSEGVYSVILGTTTALNLDFSDEYYLSIKVNADPEMDERVNLTSMPYSFRSKYVDTIDSNVILPSNLNYTGSLTNNKILTYTTSGNIFNWLNPSDLITAGDYISWDGQTLNVQDMSGGEGNITEITPMTDYLYGGGTDGEVFLYFDEAVLNDTIDARDSGDTTYTEESVYLTLVGTVFGLDESALNDTIDARDSGDTTYTNGTGLTLAGTEFSHTDTSSQSSSDNSDRTYIQDIILDTFGHITSIVTATETVTDTWWGLNEGYIYDNSNSLDFNETKLNATIEALDSDTTYTEESVYLTLVGTVFGLDEYELNSTIEEKGYYKSGDAATFSTVNTGQGAYELYAMNQDVESSDAVTFLNITLGNGAYIYGNSTCTILTSPDGSGVLEICDT